MISFSGKRFIMKKRNKSIIKAINLHYLASLNFNMSVDENGKWNKYSNDYFTKQQQVKIKIFRFFGFIDINDLVRNEVDTEASFFLYKYCSEPEKVYDWLENKAIEFLLSPVLTKGQWLKDAPILNFQLAKCPFYFNELTGTMYDNFMFDIYKSGVIPLTMFLNSLEKAKPVAEFLSPCSFATDEERLVKLLENDILLSTEYMLYLNNKKKFNMSIWKRIKAKSKLFCWN